MWLFPSKNAKDAVTSHNFVVHIGGMQIAFSKVSSIEISMETEVLIEGGENYFVHSLSKPPSAEKTLRFERGVTGSTDCLWVGASYKSIMIMVLDQKRKIRKIYIAYNAILKKRSFSDLNAMSGEVFVESLEFIYGYLTEVPMIWI